MRPSSSTCVDPGRSGLGKVKAMPCTPKGASLTDVRIQAPHIVAPSVFGRPLNPNLGSINQRVPVSLQKLIKQTRQSDFFVQSQLGTLTLDVWAKLPTRQPRGQSVQAIDALLANTRLVNAHDEMTGSISVRKETPEETRAGIRLPRTMWLPPRPKTNP